MGALVISEKKVRNQLEEIQRIIEGTIKDIKVF